MPRRAVPAGAPGAPGAPGPSRREPGQAHPGRREQGGLDQRSETGRRGIAGMAAINEHGEALADLGALAAEQEAMVVGDAGELVGAGARAGPAGFVAGLDGHRQARPIDAQLHLVDHHQEVEHEDEQPEDNAEEGREEARLFGRLARRSRRR
jgi:hypothetical protein